MALNTVAIIIVALRHFRRFIARAWKPCWMPGPICWPAKPCRSFSEIEALAELLTAYPRARAWFSFTLRDSEHLSDGTPLRDVVALLAGYPQVVALGINCIALENTTAALQHLHGLTVLPLVVYPNSGEHYDAVSKTWHHHGEHCAQLADYLPQWQAAGARLIGGCCRTTPADIAALKARS